MKKPLIETNPCLKDPKIRLEMLEQSVLSSTAIEGVHINKRKKLTRTPKEGQDGRDK